MVKSAVESSGLVDLFSKIEYDFSHFPGCNE
jgi:hypothetical protein